METDNSFLIFDYFKHKNEISQDFDFNKLLADIFKSPKTLYIFSSHSHQDHFNSGVLSWSKEKENTYYILSNDIKLFQNINNLYITKPNDEFSINKINVKTFGSTDQGVSFLVNTDGLNIFHAGDLNWWNWTDDTPEEEKEMADAFKSIIKDILIKENGIDISFFPVDGRLEENYLKGGQYFIEQLKPDVFIPMHFWEDFNITSTFKKSLPHTEAKIIEISHNNEILF